ncbi:MAG: PilZ domain-containing protein [Pyrinomonadaceae bacterium]
MAKLIRKIAAELTGFIWSRITAPRKKLCVPVTICLESERKATTKSLYIKGETKDLSKSGAALIIPTIRMCEKYLVGENRTIYAEFELPNGTIKAELVGCRYEQTGIHNSVAAYLIGVRIQYISDADRQLYEEYLKFGDSLKKSPQPEFSAAAPATEVSKN